MRTKLLKMARRLAEEVYYVAKEGSRYYICALDEGYVTTLATTLYADKAKEEVDRMRRVWALDFAREYFKGKVWCTYKRKRK